MSFRPTRKSSKTTHPPTPLAAGRVRGMRRSAKIITFGVEDDDDDINRQPATKKSKPSPAPTPLPAPTLSETATASFRLSVRMPDKYTIFPTELRQKLCTDFNSALRRSLTWVTAGTVPPLSNQYTVRHLRDAHPTLTTATIPLGTLACCSSANAALLDVFLKERGAAGNRQQTRTQFVHLQTLDDVRNPAFALLHAVRYGEVGWGFDADRCLSLYEVEIVEGRRVVEAFFVEKTKVKVEGEREGAVDGAAREAGRAGWGNGNGEEAFMAA